MDVIWATATVAREAPFCSWDAIEAFAVFAICLDGASDFQDEHESGSDDDLLTPDEAPYAELCRCFEL